jgi:hypothetical protein
MEDMEVRVLILGETRASLVFTRAGAMATRRAAMTPGLRWEACACQFQLDCCESAIFPIQFLFWSCRGLRVPLFLALNTPLFSSSGRWLEDWKLKWSASGRLLRYHVICMGSVARLLLQC